MGPVLLFAGAVGSIALIDKFKRDVQGQGFSYVTCPVALSPGWKRIVAIHACCIGILVFLVAAHQEYAGSIPARTGEVRAHRLLTAYRTLSANAFALRKCGYAKERQMTVNDDGCAGVLLRVKANLSSVKVHLAHSAGVDVVDQQTAEINSRLEKLTERVVNEFEAEVLRQTCEWN